MLVVTLVAGILAGCVYTPTAFAEGFKPEEPKQGTVQQSAQLEAEAGQKIKVETYSRPKPIKKIPPRYPRKAQRHGQEGWAVVHYMVDAQGSTYDWELTEYSGDKSFGKAALEAIKKYKYEPAQFEGRAIDAGTASKITFALADSGIGAQRRFLLRYNQFMRSLRNLKEEPEAKPPMEEAFAALEELGASNLYEDAYINIARAAYYGYHKNRGLRFRALNRAVGHESVSSYIPQINRVALHSEIFWLEVEANFLRDALDTWEILAEAKLAPEMRREMELAVGKIMKTAQSDQTVSLQGRINDTNNFSHRLLKQSFDIVDVKGELAELKLYCDKGFAGFRFQPDLRYSVEDGFQDCSLTVIGNPGTIFTLVEI
ncbi:energy transducer TonB [Pseudomonadales bacterium]|nr:energy transducer TonB [Pseudomonadales bacterium]